MSGYPWLRRRRWVVDPAFQYRFTVLLLLQMAVVVAILAILIFPQVQRIRQAAREAPVSDQAVATATRATLERTVRQVYTWSLVLVTATVVLLLVCGLAASHKLAGPVHKLKAYFRLLAAGNEGQTIRFREADRLDEFAGNINTSVAAVLARRRQVAATLTSLSAKVQEARAASPEARGGLVSQMRQLTTELRRLTQMEGQS